MEVSDIIVELNKLDIFDQEVAHMKADDLLLEALKLVLPRRSYDELKLAYERIDKWYA